MQLGTVQIFSYLLKLGGRENISKVYSLFVWKKMRNLYSTYISSLIITYISYKKKGGGVINKKELKEKRIICSGGFLADFLITVNYVC